MFTVSNVSLYLLRQTLKLLEIAVAHVTKMWNASKYFMLPKVWHGANISSLQKFALTQCLLFSKRLHVSELLTCMKVRLFPTFCICQTFGLVYMFACSKVLLLPKVWPSKRLRALVLKPLQGIKPYIHFINFASFPNICFHLTILIGMTIMCNFRKTRVCQVQINRNNATIFSKTLSIHDHSPFFLII